MLATRQKIIVAVVIGAISIVGALLITQPRIINPYNADQPDGAYQTTTSPPTNVEEVISTSTAATSASNTVTPAAPSTENAGSTPLPTTTPVAEEAISENTNIQGNEIVSEESNASEDIQGSLQTQSPSIIIDHRAIDKFEEIPDEYIEAASRMNLLFRHASVGENIRNGLNCLMNDFERRPHRCDRDIPPNEIIFDRKYNNSNWKFEFHNPPPGQNPGWWNKVYFFTDRINSLDSEEVDIVSFKFGYVDAVPGSNINDNFFENDPNDEFPSIYDLEALETQHPDKTFVYWTMAMSRAIGSAESDRFNELMREYAATHGKILMDVADIQSHRPDGSRCTDNNGKGHKALCEEYTREIHGGHLNALGQQRMAKAIWVLMATLAGWDGAIANQ